MQFISALPPFMCCLQGSSMTCGEWLQGQAEFVYPRQDKNFFGAVTKGINATNK
jgi:hypothetical protein